MYGIDVLVNEHDQILRFTSTLRGLLIRALEGDIRFKGEVSSMTAWIREYADNHHHGKEEKILFRYMLEDLGKVAEKIVRQGMLVEHDQARNVVMNLDDAYARYRDDPSEENFLDVFGLLYHYAFLLEAHAERENKVVYPFAEKNLSKERLARIDEETKAFEEEFADRREAALKELDRFENLL